jgi:hypothetical protein
MVGAYADVAVDHVVTFVERRAGTR